MKKILIISSFILVIILTSTIGYKIVSANEKVDEIIDKITEQQEKETYLTPYGYTLENPNIILNPYGISPLTAIILFETKKEEAVTITIKGKDTNSTYTNTFKSSIKHYIPVYGLYPGYKNEIIITCGDITKTYTIETSPLPTDLQPIQKENDSNKLYFITTNNYTYAIDNNNEVRWYLTKNYSKKITRLENGRLLLSTDTLTPEKESSGLIEIDLLGKIYKQYNIEDGYYGSYAETSNSIVILSKDLLEIDKQNGTVLNRIALNQKYNSITYNKESNTITLLNQQQSLKINLDTKEQSLENNSNILKEQVILLSLYNTDQNYKLVKGIKYNINQKTQESTKNIFLIGYKKIDSQYQKYNINITKTEDNLQITGEFTKSDKVYLILDKFLDKKNYDIENNHTIINQEGLKGNYSIYLKINDTLYKTNNYVKF